MHGSQTSSYFKCCPPKFKDWAKKGLTQFPDNIQLFDVILINIIPYLPIGLSFSFMNFKLVVN